MDHDDTSQVRLNGVVTFIGIVGLSVALLVLVFLLARFFSGTSRNPYGSAQFVCGSISLGHAVDGVIHIITAAVIIVVVAAPERLPLAVTLTLAYSMKKMIADQALKSNEQSTDSISTPSTNVILNHYFSGGLHSWHPNCCDSLVVSSESGYPEGLSAKLSGRFAFITNRKESWRGLEQDITDRVSASPTYIVTAWVGISGDPQGTADVQATLKIANQDSSVRYLFVGR
ncbi:calcium-transporting ATPase 10 plasma membrane-type [Phtheirospermum japonicum]|uniref:Calcium-transporting ATPase 10 plasma membrane-type n=1 Tax=Phtheirospermum japonicum TaxID=374723 RepID=A0A830BAA3_9LAMI|nr:calcium-transporting ATPase 10 plasma membrane-type [Phtheirospermum japonicum]